MDSLEEAPNPHWSTGSPLLQVCKWLWINVYVWQLYVSQRSGRRVFSRQTDVQLMVMLSLSGAHVSGWTRCAPHLEEKTEHLMRSERTNTQPSQTQDGRVIAALSWVIAHWALFIPVDIDHRGLWDQLMSEKYSIHTLNLMSDYLT